MQVKQSKAKQMKKASEESKRATGSSFGDLSLMVDNVGFGK
jgi:hypothetical protein